MHKVFETRMRIVTLSPQQSLVRRFLGICKAALCGRPLYDLAHPDPAAVFHAFEEADVLLSNPVLILVSDIVYRCKGLRTETMPPLPGKYDYLKKVFEQGPEGLRLRSVQLLRIEGDEACLRWYFYDPVTFRSELCQ